MPLPLLIAAVPAAIAAATTAAGATTVTTTTAAAIAVGTGSAGAVSVGTIWAAVSWFKPNRPAQTREHQANLKNQRKMTEARIIWASAQVENLAQDASALRDDISEAVLNSKLSTEHLQELTQRTTETTERLADVLQKASDASKRLKKSAPLLREISEQSHLMGTATVELLRGLNTILEQQIMALHQNAGNIDRLEKIVGRQADDIARLGSAVHILTDENQALSQANRVQEMQLSVKDQQIAKLENVSARFSAQCGFFKDKLKQHLSEASTANHQPTTVIAGLS